jgi:TP901 family phage tail tape measure protein
LAVRQFAKFDDAIRATAAVTGSLGPQGAAAFAMLNDKARELGATTSFTAVEVANLMTELGRAGFKPDEINAMTGAVLDLARATGTDATRSAGIMAATLRQFGLGAEEAARAADVLTYTANNTFNTVDSLGESLKYAGPVAKSLGMSLEDTAAILGVLGNVGIQGSEAGTALRRLSVISAGTGEKLNKLFGIDNMDAAGNLKPLVQILDEINTATTSMPVAERTAKMAQAFGLLGITSANVLSQTAGGVRNLRAGLDTAAGTANNTAKAMDAGLGGALRIMLSAVEGTALAIGDALAPSLMNAVNFMERASTAATAFVKANGDVVLSVAAGVLQFSAMGAALFVVGKGVAAASAVFGTLLSVAAGVAAAFMGVVTTLAGILAATASAIVGIVSYGAASVAAAVASGAAWLLANSLILVQIGLLGLAVADLFRYLGGVELVSDGIAGLAATGRNAIGVLSQIGVIGREAFASIYESIMAGNLEGAMSVALRGMEAAFRTFSANFMNMVDEWGANLVNAFDYWISNIPFLRFAAFDKFEFSLFGSSENAQTPGQRAEERLRKVRENTQERNTGLKDASQRFQSELGTQRTRNVLMSQTNDVIGGVEAAKTLDDLRSIADEFFTLKSMGGVSPEQEKRYMDAANQAAEKLTPTAVGEESPAATKKPQVESPEERAQRLAEERMALQDQISRQAETVGTFSAQAASGMGFGGTVFQEQLKELKAIRKELEEDIKDEVLA